MSATRQGFITMHAGQKRPSERGTFWDVAAGQVQQLDFALPRGSVIFGRLTDDAGEPLAGIHVTTLRVFYSGNGARLRPWTSMPYSGATDDRGEFRIPGLGPGTYVLAADSQNNALGESYATTYYPGTTNLSEARRFQIGLNEQLSANFSMMTTRQVRVAGQVRSSNGEPLHNYRVLLRTETGLGTKGGLVTSGSFDVGGVMPGAYTLDIRPASMGGMPDFSNQTEFASVPIIVGEEDVSGLVITTGRGATMSGRVIYDGTSESRATQRQSSRVVANILDGGFGMRSPSADRTNGVIADDGSFTITGVYGRILFRTEAPGWQLRSVILDGVDITDVPFDASGGGSNKLEIVLTDQRQRLIASVVHTLGKPSERFSVLIFPSTVKEGSVPGRFITLNELTDSTETFEISHLPAGEYLRRSFYAGARRRTIRYRLPRSHQASGDTVSVIPRPDHDA